MPKRYSRASIAGLATYSTCVVLGAAFGMADYFSSIAPARAQSTVQASSNDKTAPSPGASGQPLPRFVSLKSDRVNMRSGPGTEYPMQWVYRRAGLPVEVIREFEAWRQVRDADGTTG